MAGKGADAKGLILYHFEGCPYCQLVRDAVERLGIQLEMRDVRMNSAHMSELQAARGRSTVPVLRIQDEGPERWMPESLDIVAYLEKRFAA